MEQEEYIVDGHKVTHSVHLGDREIFLAVQQDAPLPFYVGYIRRQQRTLYPGRYSEIP